MEIPKDICPLNKNINSKKIEQIGIVRKGLECLARNGKENDCDSCPYELVKDYCTPVIARDALSLLKTGEWIDRTKTIGFPRAECSACGSEAGASWMLYCPNCGAKMNVTWRDDN